MTDDDLDEMTLNYRERYGDRIRTHNPDCWKWADHPECTVQRLTAEVRRLRALLAVRDADVLARVERVAAGCGLPRDKGEGT